MKLIYREPTEEMIRAAGRHYESDEYTGAGSTFKAMYDTAPELTVLTAVDMEPAKPVTYFCNKCGYFGDSASHMILPEKRYQCGYYAAPDGPWYSAAQLSTVRVEAEVLQAENELLRKENEELKNELSECSAVIDNIEPSNRAFENWCALTEAAFILGFLAAAEIGKMKGESDETVD